MSVYNWNLGTWTVGWNPRPHCGTHLGACEWNERGKCEVMLRLIREQERRETEAKEGSQLGPVIRADHGWDDD